MPKYGDPRRRVAFFEALLQRTGALPGVEATGFVSHVPLASAPLVADVAFEPGTRPGEAFLANCSVVGGDWLAAMRIPLVRGRAFADRDAAGAAPVVIVSARLAARLWPNADPIGRRLVIGGSLGADQAPREIVGVAGDVRSSLEMGRGRSGLFAVGAESVADHELMVRTAGDPAQWADAVRGAVHGIDRDQAVYNIGRSRPSSTRAVAARRFQAFLLSLFAAIALMLAATGVYSVVSYGVRQRRPGDRSPARARRAEGGRPRAGGGRQSAVGRHGPAVGRRGAFFAARSLSGALYEVPPTDLLTFAAAAAVALIVALLGASLAARAALAVDPLVALRDG